LILLSAGFSVGGIAAQGVKPGFAGLEFYGSSQVSRSELEKYLALRPGARLEQITRAVDRLNQKLAERHLNSTVEIVQGGPLEVFVVVGVNDSSTDSATPTRHLRRQRHVQLSTEKPFILLDELNARLEKLSDEGRPWSEQMRSGLRYFSDERANQTADEIVQLVPDMRTELLAVTESDPDPNRRRRAGELLCWAGSIPDTFTRLMPALDDADSGVRATAARYMFSRLELLPDDYPFDTLVESFSRLLTRPTHQDRSKALYCLLALCLQRPELTTNVKVFDEEKVKHLSQTSNIASIKGAAEKLLAVLSNPPKFRQRMTDSPLGPNTSGF
jgi:hypothetical protein